MDVTQETIRHYT